MLLLLHTDTVTGLNATGDQSKVSLFIFCGRIYVKQYKHTLSSNRTANWENVLH